MFVSARNLSRRWAGGKPQNPMLEGTSQTAERETKAIKQAGSRKVLQHHLQHTFILLLLQAMF